METEKRFKPVTGSDISKKISSQIEAAILNGDIELGTRLPSERDMQTQFQAGRGAIREALQALKQKGIIEIKKGVKGGAYVKKMEIDNASESLSILLKQNRVPLEQLVEFRDAVDQTEVILASLRGNQGERKELVELSHRLMEVSRKSDDPDVEQIKTIDREMNLLLAKMTKNTIFEWIKQTIQSSIGSYDSLLYENPNYREKTISNWINTAKQIAAGEPLKALSLCSYHYVLLQSCIKENNDKALDEGREK